MEEVEQQHKKLSKWITKKLKIFCIRNEQIATDLFVRIVICTTISVIIIARRTAAIRERYIRVDPILVRINPAASQLQHNIPTEKQLLHSTQTFDANFFTKYIPHFPAYVPGWNGIICLFAMLTWKCIASIEMLLKAAPTLGTALS